MEKNFTPLLVVAAALSDAGGRWLMHRRPFDKDHGGLWEFPGGKVDPGEDCRAALVREIAEETTLSICADDLVETGFAVSSPGSADPAIVLLLYKTSLWEASWHLRKAAHSHGSTARRLPDWTWLRWT